MLVEIGERDIKFPKSLPSISYLVISCYTGSSAQELANDLFLKIKLVQILLPDNCGFSAHYPA